MMTKNHSEDQKSDARSARRKWVTAAFGVAIAVVIIGSSYYLLFTATESKPPLKEVDGGVEWILDNLDDRFYQNWSNNVEFNGTTVVESHVMVACYVGELHSGPKVQWELSSEPLLNHSPAVFDFGAKDADGLSLRLVVADTLGDGMVGKNDSITLVPCNSTSFVPDLVYHIHFGFGSRMGGAWMGVSFKLHDGRLDSWISEDYREQWM